jgi:hypothetical protein
VFRAWVPVLGRPSVELEAFGEEVRDPHQYPIAYGYHRQGEIVAKIVTPPSQIEGFGKFEGPTVAAALAAGAPAKPVSERRNLRYVHPENYVNIREVL